MPSVVDRIRAWATQLRYWEQAALELIVNGKEITEPEYQSLLDQFMQDIGLVQLPGSARPKLVFPCVSTDEQGTGYRLERLFNLRNVNGLPSGQEIVFGKQVTIIYGDTGAGKTGYARPLGGAAFARGDRDVLPNARLAFDSAIVPQAEIEVSRDGSKSVVTWTRGQTCSELSGFYVFDSISVTAHLSRANTLSFSPAGLLLLERLAEVTDAVRARLKLVLDARDTAHSFRPLFPGSSAVTTHIDTLGISTDMRALDKLGNVTDADGARIKDLEIEIGELSLRRVPKRIAELKQQARDLRDLHSSLVSSEGSLDATCATAVGQLVDDLTLARNEAERSSADQLQFAPFKQVGTAVWREFVEAAKHLADAEVADAAYPEQGDHCLLCRQPLSKDAAGLIRRLWDFLRSEAVARFEAAQGACAKKARELERVNLGFFVEDSVLRRTLNILAADLVSIIDAEVSTLRARKSELVSSLEGGVRALTPIQPSKRGRLQDIAKNFEAQATSLENDRTQEELTKLTAELRELQHRRTLFEQLPAIRTYIQTQLWVADGRQNMGSTYHITSKHNELFSELVTERFLHLFQGNLAEFNPNLRVTIETHGRKGQTVRQVVLNPQAFPSRYPIEGVLSEGEKRTVALVDFLTEAALDDRCNGIILDDPVTSLDLAMRKTVARKLADIARTKQVIVFTHDLSFLHNVKTEAKARSVGVLGHWVIRDQSGAPGMVFLNNGPICEGDFKSAQLARERYAKSKSSPPQEQQLLLEQGFGSLRSSYEAFIIFDLFAGVVERFEERTSFGRLRDVSLDKAVVNEVVDRMEFLSRYIGAHLHSDSFAGEKPTPADLLREIEAFEALRKRHREAKKTAEQGVAAPGPVASKPAEEGVQTGVRMTREAVELEARSRLNNQLRTRN